MLASSPSEALFDQVIETIKPSLQAVHKKQPLLSLLAMIHSHPNVEAVADILLAHGIPLTDCDKEGNTALHHCVQYNNPSLMAYLLTKGADITVKNTNGKTAYEVSSFERNYL